MVEKIARQAIAALDEVLNALDADPALTGAAVHVQWAIDLLSDKIVPASIAPSIATRPPVPQD